MLSKKWIIGLVVVVVHVGLEHAGAAVLTFTDEGTFLGSMGDHSLESFETLPTGVRTTDPIVTPHFAVSLDPLPGSVADMYIGEGVYSNGLRPTHGDQYLVAGDQLSPAESAFQLIFDFPAPLVSFGLSVVDYGDKRYSGHLAFSNDVGDSFIIASGSDFPNDNELFFGVVNTDHPFSQAVIEKTNYGDGIVIDEVYHQAVPEPSTFAIWSLLATLGLTVSWWRRRRGVA